MHKKPVTHRDSFSRSLAQPVALTLEEVKLVAGGSPSLPLPPPSPDQVWDALAQANADAKARSKPHYIA